MNEAKEYGFNSMEMPPVRSRMGRVINDFIDSGEECMGKEYEDKEQMMRDIGAAKGYLHHHKIKIVKVRQQGNLLMLVRKE